MSTLESSKNAATTGTTLPFARQSTTVSQSGRGNVEPKRFSGCNDNLEDDCSKNHNAPGVAPSGKTAMNERKPLPTTTLDEKEQAKLAHKRDMNRIHSRRKRVKEKIEIEVLHEQRNDYMKRNEKLRTDNAKLERMLQSARAVIALIEQSEEKKPPASALVGAGAKTTPSVGYNDAVQQIKLDHSNSTIPAAATASYSPVAFLPSSTYAMELRRKQMIANILQQEQEKQYRQQDVMIQQILHQQQQQKQQQELQLRRQLNSLASWRMQPVELEVYQRSLPQYASAESPEHSHPYNSELPPTLQQQLQHLQQQHQLQQLNQQPLHPLQQLGQLQTNYPTLANLQQWILPDESIRQPAFVVNNSSDSDDIMLARQLIEQNKKINDTSKYQENFR